MWILSGCKISLNLQKYGIYFSSVISLFVSIFGVMLRQDVFPNVALLFITSSKVLFWLPHCCGRGMMWQLCLIDPGASHFVIITTTTLALPSIAKTPQSSICLLNFSAISPRLLKKKLLLKKLFVAEGTIQPIATFNRHCSKLFFVDVSGKEWSLRKELSI